MLVTKMVKTVTKTLHLSETHFVSYTRRCNRYSGTYTIEYTGGEAVEIYMKTIYFHMSIMKRSQKERFRKTFPYSRLRLKYKKYSG